VNQTRLVALERAAKLGRVRWKSVGNATNTVAPNQAAAVTIKNQARKTQSPHTQHRQAKQHAHLWVFTLPQPRCMILQRGSGIQHQSTILLLSHAASDVDATDDGMRGVRRRQWDTHTSKHLCVKALCSSNLPSVRLRVVSHSWHTTSNTPPRCSHSLTHTHAYHVARAHTHTHHCTHATHTPARASMYGVAAT